MIPQTISFPKHSGKLPLFSQPASALHPLLKPEKLIRPRYRFPIPPHRRHSDRPPCDTSPVDPPPQAHRKTHNTIPLFSTPQFPKKENPRLSHSRSLRRISSGTTTRLRETPDRRSSSPAHDREQPSRRATSRTVAPSSTHRQSTSLSA